MAGLRLVVLNAAQHDALFDPLRELERDGVEIVHASYHTDWQDVSRRRRGEPALQEEIVSTDLTAALARADALFGFFVPRGLLGLTPELRWLETPSTGVDHLRGTGILESQVAVTNVGGLFSGVIAEHVFAGMLHFAKRLAHFEQLRRSRRWEMTRLDSLEGKTLGLVGVGSIGRAVAARAQAFGMRVIGLGRRDPTGRSVPGVDRLLPRAARKELLADADYVVVAVTGSEETHGMIGRVELARMRPNAVLINVARGTVVDEAALAEALAAGRIAGAALDVFAEEPLPEGSPLWGLPNVLLTPHVAVSFPEYLPRAIGHLLDNARRLLAGEPLLDRVTASQIG